MDSCTHKVALLGHSYIRRLEEYTTRHRPERKDLDLQSVYPGVEVKFIHQGGAEIPQIRALLPQIKIFKPSTIILQVGGNDISNCGVEPVTVARQIITLAHDIRRNAKHGTKKSKSVKPCNVFICGTFPRYYHERRQGCVPSQIFNKKAELLNWYLTNMCSQSTHIFFQDTVPVPQYLYLRDKVHFNYGPGYDIYYQYIRAMAMSGISNSRWWFIWLAEKKWPF